SAGTVLPVEYIMPNWKNTSSAAFASPSVAASIPITSKRPIPASPIFTTGDARARAIVPATVARRRSLPGVVHRLIGAKFESPFKRRDESNVNEDGALRRQADPNVDKPA